MGTADGSSDKKKNPRFRVAVQLPYPAFRDMFFLHKKWPNVIMIDTIHLLPSDSNRSLGCSVTATSAVLESCTKPPTLVRSVKNGEKASPAAKKAAAVKQVVVPKKKCAM